MRGVSPALPPAFSLLRSEFNEFLFAPIGEEGNDTLLTVLSALARLGLDPWQESARLALLSREKATQSLASMIENLPNGRWAQADVGAIAARLIALLPAKRVAALPSRKAAYGQYPKHSRITRFIFIAIVGGAMFFTVANYLRPAAVDADKAAAVSLSPEDAATGPESPR
jgi:hypothetical protein